MSKKLISVIVPVYNNEKYVNRCIDSILNQSYENLEVILINDESTDNSINICNQWAEKDKRIKIINQQHSGTSFTRNHGASVATGDYISFVDNDDWLRPNMYEEMLKTATETNADLTFTRFINVDEKYNRNYTKEINLSKEKLLNPLYFFIKAKKKNAFLYNIACCNRILIKKEILKNVSFSTDLNHYENVLFVLNLIKQTDKIAIADEHLYNHFNPKFDNKVYDEHYFAALKTYYEELKEYFENNYKELSYLADHEYIMKYIKAKIKDKDFSKTMKTLLIEDNIFASHLTKENYKKLKAAGYGSTLSIKLIYGKKWRLLKTLYKNL